MPFFLCLFFILINLIYSLELGGSILGSIIISIILEHLLQFSSMLCIWYRSWRVSSYTLERRCD